MERNETMRSFKIVAVTGLTMATLIASVTVAGAMLSGPTANLFEAGTDEEIVTPASPERLEGDIHGDMVEFTLGAEYDGDRAPAVVAARDDGFVDIHGDMVEFALGAEYYWETPPPATNPVVTIGANDLDEQLIAFALQNEVDVRTPPRAANPAVTIGVNDLDEQLITFALQDEVDPRTLPAVGTAALSGVDPYEEHGRLIDYVLHVEMSE